jgi:putative zinc finger protein
MRHIPEEELHAYLDQGLSRSQCVEIESHLDVCPTCQATRDGIAALRDRTTALLAKLAPPRSFPPAFESLRRRADLEVSARRRRIQLAAWAASLVAAVGLGWTANYLFIARTTQRVQNAPQAISRSPAALPVAQSIVVAPPEKPPVARSLARRQPKRAAPESARATLPTVVAPSSLELSSGDVPRAEPELELDGMWRTMSWDGAQAEAGDKLPHIDGLPVVRVQLQLVPTEQGKQPLTVVAQQLASGEVIRTIEGPTDDVSHLLAGKTMSDPNAPTAENDSEPSRTDRTMAMQRGDRMLVITGALPSDSLLAMIRRLNAEMRSK